MQTAIFMALGFRLWALGLPHSALDQPAGVNDTRLKPNAEGLKHHRSSYLLNSNAAFVPPKPNEFDKAWRIGIWRLLCAT